MIDLTRFENILSIDNEDTDLKFVNDVLRSYRDHDQSLLFYTITDLFTDIKVLKENIVDIIKLLKENKNYELIGLLAKQKYNTDLLEKILHIAKDDTEIFNDLLDSFSNNQFASKTALLDAVNSLGVLNNDSTVVIWGSWYGSILIPKLTDKVKKIISIDLDPEPLQIAKNRLFNNYKNVDYICDDVFATCRRQYLDTNLIINTSCEHMQPMNEWPWFAPGALKEDNIPGKDPKLSSNCYFAFQSNNMFGIEGHVNCVNSMEEFKAQLPERAEVLYEEEVEDTRGTRYMLVGKFIPL